MRVLDSRAVSVREDLTVGGEPGNRFIHKGSVYLCGESPDEKARAYDFLVSAPPLEGKSVAWIGGGMCVGPTLFAAVGCKQTIYEIEPALVEFCPEEALFVPGDWRMGLAGTFDVIVFNVGGEVPREELRKHLNPGGVILPRRSL